MNTKSAWQHFTELPEEAQRQVVEFIEFLSSRATSKRGQAKSKRGKLADEKFVGMWSKRADLKDSSTWVRELRKSEWTNK